MRPSVWNTLTARERAAVLALTCALAIGSALAWAGPDRSGLRIVRASPARAALLPDRRIDVNTATYDELVMLPGIGPVRARAIIEERQRRGAYPCLDSLRRIRGIGPMTVERLREEAYAGERDR